MVPHGLALQTPIQRRESPNPREPPQREGQLSQTSQLPPTEDRGLEPHLRAIHKLPNSNKPENWEDMSKKQRRQWSKKNPNPDTASPEPILDATIQVPSRPATKPSNWGSIPIRDKEPNPHPSPEKRTRSPATHDTSSPEMSKPYNSRPKRSPPLSLTELPPSPSQSTPPSAPREAPARNPSQGILFPQRPLPPIRCQTPSPPSSEPPPLSSQSSPLPEDTTAQNPLHVEILGSSPGSPPGKHRRPPDSPAEWDSMTRKARDRWFKERAKANQEAPDFSTQATTAPPTTKPADWPLMTAREKAHWLSRHPGGL